jgi:hypothetical protein
MLCGMVRDRDFGCKFAVRSGVASGIRLRYTTHKIYTPFSSINGVVRDLAAASQLGNLYRICGIAPSVAFLSTSTHYAVL